MKYGVLILTALLSSATAMANEPIRYKGQAKAQAPQEKAQIVRPDLPCNRIVDADLIGMTFQEIVDLSEENSKVCGEWRSYYNNIISRVNSDDFKAQRNKTKVEHAANEKIYDLLGKVSGISLYNSLVVLNALNSFF